MHTAAYSYRKVCLSQGESKSGRMVDALAHGGDEGRDKLRKAAVRRKYPVTRRCPNGTTQQAEGLLSLRRQGG